MEKTSPSIKKDLSSSQIIQENVEITQGYIKTGTPFLRLYHTVISPSKTIIETKKGIKASLLIFHGFTEDSSSYMQMGSHLAVEGCLEIHMIDFRGFGYSTGVREHIDLIELQHDIIVLLQEVLKRNISRNLLVPVFLLGNSYAGNVLSGLLINNSDIQLAGVIMLSPAFSTHYQYSQLALFEKILYLYIYPLIQVNFAYAKSKNRKLKQCNMQTQEY